MENKSDTKLVLTPTLQAVINKVPESKKVLDKKICSSVKMIHLSGDEVVITDNLPGVYCEGTQYYDFKYVKSINNTGMANLIIFLKSILKEGIEVQFVNVNEKIKAKIKSMGLDHILHCC